MELFCGRSTPEPRNLFLKSYTSTIYGILQIPPDGEHDRFEKLGAGAFNWALKRSLKRHLRLGSSQKLMAAWAAEGLALSYDIRPKAFGRSTATSSFPTHGRWSHPSYGRLRTGAAPLWRTDEAPKGGPPCASRYCLWLPCLWPGQRPH